METLVFPMKFIHGIILILPSFAFRKKCYCHFRPLFMSLFLLLLGWEVRVLEQFSILSFKLAAIQYSLET